MTSETSSDLKLLKNVILNTSEPLLIKNALDWKLLSWDLNKWQEVLGTEQLQFRLGKNCYTKEPQFENTTDVVNMTFKEFLECQAKNTHNWLYFDYKYLKEWLRNIPELRTEIDWKNVGFPERNVEDSTIWIGSQGAHTPCHIDTYGCNIITQILGRKRWILFPPNENLLPTRIPYEESSIYSSLNLFSPNLDDFKSVKHCRSIVLNPGDVLILPHRWWHYVENIELAISINTWVELPIDHEERIGESVVQMLISQLGKQLTPDQQQYFVNPTNTSEPNILNQSLSESVKLTMMCIKQYKNENQKRQSTHIDFTQQEGLQKLKNIEVIEQLSNDDLTLLLQTQRNKFRTAAEKESDMQENKELTTCINALLHNDVINLVKEKLLNDFGI